MDYLDFDLEIANGPDGTYATRVLRSPAGEASGVLRFPLDKLALENRLQALQLALLKSGRGRRRLELPETQLVRQFGTELWESLFTGDIVSRFDVSRSEARAQDKGLRVRLRVIAPELSALPWEFLYDTRRDAFIALSATTPLVRYTALAQPIEPLRVRPPLRVLGMVAAPTDLDPLDVTREKERLEQALGRLRNHGLVELRWVPNGGWRDLVEALRHGPWHVFHFIGHGGFDNARREGLIALVDEAKKAHLLTASELALLLGDHDSLRLAVLNSCDSAKADEADVFSSTAASLVRHGTPAVVAMQYEITDLAAIEFSRSFYEAIADGVPVDSSVSEARKGVAVSISGTLEWGTPVLHTRAPDGVLFTISAEDAASAFIDRSEAPPVEPPVAAPLVAAAGSDPAREAADGNSERREVLGRSWRQRAPRWALPFGITAVAIAVVLGVMLLRPGAPAGPVLTLSASLADIGTSVQVRGTGYNPGEAVNLVSGGSIIATLVAGPDGGFATEWIVPWTTSPTLEIQAVGIASGKVGRQSIAVRPGGVAAGESATPGPTGSPAPGESVGASGSALPSPIPSASSGPTKTQVAATPRITPAPRTPTPPPPTKKPASPTPAPAPTIHVNRTPFLASGDHLNADTGLVGSSGADLRFNQVAAAENYLIPENGARLGFWGASSPSYDDCRTASMGTGQLLFGQSAVGSYLCVRTGINHVSRLQIVSLSDAVQVHVWTWW